MRRGALAILTFTASLAIPAGALAADGPCAVAERDFNYWVFGSNAAFNTFRAQCAAGKSAPEALIASQRGNPAALALMRDCGAEMVQLMMDRRMDQMCEQFPKLGTAAVSRAPAPAAPAAPAGLAGLPECVQTLQGTFKSVVSQKVMLFDVNTEVLEKWSVTDGKPASQWSIPSNGVSGATRFAGVEGADLVVESMTNGYSLVTRVKIRFDPACRSYTGTAYNTMGGLMQLKGERVEGQ